MPLEGAAAVAIMTKDRIVRKKAPVISFLSFVNAGSERSLPSDYIGRTRTAVAIHPASAKCRCSGKVWFA
jgi:hypothetical protein